MGIGMMGPGCCCQTCTIASDDFSVDNLATDWDVRSGTPTVASGVMSFSAGTNLAIHNNAAGASVDAVYAGCAFAFSSTSDIGRLIIAYVDDNNYWFAQVQPGASDGTLKLFERSGGTTTQRGTTATVNGFTTGSDPGVQLCYSNGIVKAFVNSAVDASISYAATLSVGGTKAGVGGSEGGTVTVDDFAYNLHESYSPGCSVCSDGNCDFCTGGTYPPRMQVDIAGLANFDCQDCDTDWNGTFICTAPEIYSTVCFWSYRGGPLCLGTLSVVVGVQKVGANYVLAMTITDDFTHTITCQATQATPFDCTTFSAKALAFSSQNGLPCTNLGTFTVTITALDP